MDGEETPKPNRIGITLLFLQKILIYSASGIVIFILLTSYFYLVLVPRYEENLKQAVESQKCFTYEEDEGEESEGTDTDRVDEQCPGQAYDQKFVKEFYSIKALKDQWLPLSSNTLGIQ